METAHAREVEQARKLERGLIRLRWFALVLGIYLTSQTNTGYRPFAPEAALEFAYGILAAVGLVNAALAYGVGRIQTLEGLRRMGLAAFLFDAAAIFGVAWAYSYDPKGPQWVVIYILPLEGALRYQLKGALVSVALTLVNETIREVYLSIRFAQPDPVAFTPAWPFQIANIMFRVGLQAIIAAVAGFMARSLARQRDKASEAAARAEQVARRESEARRELAAFNSAILAGVAAEDLETSIPVMADAIGRDLGFETFSILLREGDALVVKGMYGMPFYREPIPIGTGVTGTVASTLRPLVVPDVRHFPSYIEAHPDMRSEMAVPMQIGEELIGVLDVESRRPDGFDEAAVGLLTRLADHIALVAHSNRLLSQQRETMNRLQELDQMKSDFVAITSHELRTPITAIRGFINTLLRNQDRLAPAQVASFMGIIDRQSARLARLVDDLLLISRIEAGKIRMSTEEVPLQSVLMDALDAVGPDERSRVLVRVEPADAAVVIDPQRVEQVLRNLIENALKFSAPGSQVRVEGHVRDGAVELSVADEGVGIAEADLPRIFDRFHQGGRAMTREAEGAGLGLYITRTLVEAMGGTIDVDSSPGRGSTFRVTLPGRAGAPSAEGLDLAEAEAAS